MFGLLIFNGEGCKKIQKKSWRKDKGDGNWKESNRPLNGIKINLVKLTLLTKRKWNRTFTSSRPSDSNSFYSWQGWHLQ